jgi:hypothetical protein
VSTVCRLVLRTERNVSETGSVTVLRWRGRAASADADSDRKS